MGRGTCGVLAWSSGVDTWCDGKVESAAFESEPACEVRHNRRGYVAAPNELKQSHSATSTSRGRSVQTSCSPLDPNN